MNDDGPLNDLFATLREIKPPERVRAANRDAVRTAAAPPRATNRWSYRTVATPLPAALAALLLVSLTLNVVLWRGQRRPSDLATTRDEKIAATPAVERGSPAASNLAMSEPQIQYSETQRYLSGVGVVDRRASYVFKGLP
jgi:hypothetical protein